MKGLHRMLLQVDEDVWRIAIGNDDLDAGIGNFLGGLCLRCHTATAMTALAGLYVFADVAIIIYRWDDACMRLAGIAVVDSVHIGKEDERVLSSFGQSVPTIHHYQ